MKRNRKIWIMIVVSMLLMTLPGVAVAMQPYTIHGIIYNGSEGGIEADVQVLLNYSYGGNSVSQTTNTGSDGSFSFTIMDYDVPSTYTINASKGVYLGPLMLDSILKDGGQRDFGYISIFQNSTDIRLVPVVPVINKGSSALVDVIVEPNGIPIEGVQFYYNFSNHLSLNIDNFTEGNFFNRNSKSWFSGNTVSSSGIYGTIPQGKIVTFSYAAPEGPYYYNTTGTHARYNGTGMKNGTASLKLDHSIVVSNQTSNWWGISWARSIVYATVLKVTQPCDVNGDFSCNLADLGKINQYWNQTGSNLCPEVWGRCDLNNDDSVNAMDKALEKLGYGKPIIQGQ